MTDALLLLIVILLAAMLWQRRQQHRQLIEWIDAFAEMVGEAIAMNRKDSDDEDHQ
jgi:hypothetical protein